MGSEARVRGLAPLPGVPLSSPRVSLGLGTHHLCSGSWLLASDRLASSEPGLPLRCFWILRCQHLYPLNWFQLILTFSAPFDLFGFRGPSAQTGLWPLAGVSCLCTPIRLPLGLHPSPHLCDSSAKSSFGTGDSWGVTKKVKEAANTCWAN